MILNPRYTAKSLLAVVFIVFSQCILFAARTSASPVPDVYAKLVERYVKDNVSPKDTDRPDPEASDYPADAEIANNFRQKLPSGWVFWTGIAPSTEIIDAVNI
jgi:hypothetical protein